MDHTKHKLKHRLEQWKTAASQLISGSEEKQDEIVLDLDPALLEKCQHQADQQQTSINVIINHIMRQYWAQADTKPQQAISREQLERNPLLYLDALSKRDFNRFGGDEFAEE